MENKNYLYIGIAIVLIVVAIVLIANTSETVIDTEPQRVYCMAEQRGADFCTEQWAPVCGYMEDGTYETYSNDCYACKNPEVVYWIEGEC